MLDVSTSTASLGAIFPGTIASDLPTPSVAPGTTPTDAFRRNEDAMQTDDIDKEALRLTEMAALSVRALEERKAGCSETNNIGLMGAIRRALVAERERCAKIAESAINEMNGQRKAGMARAIARRIREQS